MYVRVISGQLDRILVMDGGRSAFDIAGQILTSEIQDMVRINHVVWVRTSDSLESVMNLESEVCIGAQDESPASTRDTLIHVTDLIEEFDLEYRRLKAGWGIMKVRI